MTVDEDELPVTRTRTTRVSAAFAAFATDPRKRDRDGCDSPVNDKSETSAPDRKKQNTSGGKNNIIATSSATTTEDNNDVPTTLISKIQITTDNISDRSNGTYARINNNKGITNPLLQNVSSNSCDGNDEDQRRRSWNKSQAIPTLNSSMAGTLTKKLPPVVSSTKSMIANWETLSTQKNGSEDNNNPSETHDTIIADRTSTSPGLSPKGKANNVSGSGSGGCLLWFVLSCFIIFTVMFGMVWSGLLLNERVVCQLESFECRERLQQIHHEIGIPTKDLDFNNNKIDDDILDEQRYYWQELEAQVRYWKKEAKKFQRYSDGYKDQCNDDLRQLLQEVVQPQPQE